MRTEAARRLLPCGCAIFLLLAIVAPRELARTSWERGGTVINDSPAGYVLVMSLCGAVALVALSVAMRRWRARIAAALLAATAFAFGTYVAGSYWANLAWGATGLEGRLDASMRSPPYSNRVPLLLPVFLFACIVGVVSALALAIDERRDAVD
ncbi:MAG TPA: hypothetical protein VFU81_19730 [Thermomicrobiales bacterium]|nr:hypothetical protein [Thermomicrobiales bacterium]